MKNFRLLQEFKLLMTKFQENTRSIERSLTKSMDKVSNLAFLLYNESTNVAIKQAAV
jgi:hypothetical protein